MDGSFVLEEMQEAASVSGDMLRQGVVWNMGKPYEMEEKIAYALDRVILNIAPGKFTVILGPSGSENSILLTIFENVELLLIAQGMDAKERHERYAG